MVEVLNKGEFGEISGPIFIDGLDCHGEEEHLLVCETASELGLIDEKCACTDCAETLAIRCPGKRYLLFLHNAFSLSHCIMYTQMKMNA